MKEQPKRIETIDVLRGIAALAVFIFHSTNGNTNFLPNGLFKSVGSYGWLGVEIFFVLSGFVIPFSLHRAGYKTGRYGFFLLKRIVRLDPPYLVTVVLVIFLGFLGERLPGFQGSAFTVTAPQVLLHVAYLNTFFGYPWLNPVFWSLAIELQYYLFIGLLFPLVSHQKSAIRSGVFLAFAILAVLLPQERFLFHWLFLFMLGMLAFQFRVGIITRLGFFVCIVFVACGAIYTQSVLIAVLATLTACAIAFIRIGGRVLLFFGTISYSLYLIHVPIGMRIINLGARLGGGTPVKLLVLMIAWVTTIGTAYVLYSWVELPARRWSGAINYRNKKEPQSPVESDSEFESTLTEKLEMVEVN
jgi:peptidoglycan/LPS O-acetylase OafA/YrhL